MNAWGHYVSLPAGQYQFATRPSQAGGRRLKMLGAGEVFTVPCDGCRLPTGAEPGMGLTKGSVVRCDRVGDEYTASLLVVEAK